MSAREEILSRIRGAFADAPDTPVEVPRRYARAVDGVDVVALFAERVGDYRARVRVVDPAALADVVAVELRDAGVEVLAVPADLPGEWSARTTARVHADSPPLSVEALDGCDGVLTGCAVAIAETGTIVLDGGPGQGRRALTLVPDVHVCVVAAASVVGTVPEAVARLAGTRPLTWISGPSATSDIELDRVEGVHGPRNLVVLVVDPGRR
ncbi:LUD domain-containing protein [Micromonospora sp. WMMC241]|uniref:LutC/YkgG family protein n=1 Tax=Micromonospora sp. WMMC241 TaxID=3015159 RepID=UPI0022B67A8A|nr:LUD domain-containing protein [Micromonospora sp. WMMC241]MCZ7438245.1 LUD domain-containing protein [Micromonospora sp. WMMC241]